MSKIASSFFDIRYLDTLAQAETRIHRVDPRAKLITTIFFILIVVSFNKYEISALIPFFLYPLTLMSIGNIPVNYIIKKILVVAPFALMIGLFNPFIDRSIHVYIGSFGVSGGWISFFTLILRFVLTVGSALVFIGVTSFNGFCLALEKLKVPEILIIQLMFLYRYLFILIEEAVRMSKARALRTFGSRGLGLKTFGSLVGHLLLKTLNRAERIYLAMLCRGFNGHIRIIRPLHFTVTDGLFIFTWSSLFLIMRLYNIPRSIGTVVIGIFS